MSFELKTSAKDRAVGRFIGAVRKNLLIAALEEKERSGITQQSIANILGINRSVINRLLKGQANLTLRSVAEIAWALGRRPSFELLENVVLDGSNQAKNLAPQSASGDAPGSDKVYNEIHELPSPPPESATTNKAEMREAA